LYGCETRSITFREKHTLRAFQNRVLGRMFGPKREEVAGSSRGLHNEELHKLYASPNIVRAVKSGRLRWEGNVAHMAVEKCIQHFGGKT
jgi:hypothetical protein